MNKLYSEKTHSKRLIAMLEQDAYGDGLNYACPGSKDYRVGKGMIKDKSEEEVCTVCLEFVGLSLDNIGVSCPCDVLGCDEAAKASWLKLEEKGYI